MGAGHDHLPADVRAKREQVKEAIGTIVPEGGWPDWLLDGDIESAQQYVMNYAVYLNSKHSGWGTAPPGASRAGAIRYLKAALEALGDKQDKRFKEPVFWLLSNSRLWPSDAHRGLTEADPVFDDIQAMAKSRLDPLGEKYESEVYVGKGFGALMGHLGSDIGQSAHPRQDTHGTLYFPKNEKIDEIYGVFSGFVYLYMLRIACEAIDKQFQAKSATALSTIKGVNATNVDTMNQTAPLVLNKSPHPKGTMRMWAKYNSDHSEADLPKCAENADCNRDAWVVDSSLMCEAYEEAARIFGKPIRVKNNLSPDFDARTRASGAWHDACPSRVTSRLLTILRPTQAIGASSPITASTQARPGASSSPRSIRRPRRCAMTCMLSMRAAMCRGARPRARAIG